MRFAADTIGQYQLLQTRLEACSVQWRDADVLDEQSLFELHAYFVELCTLLLVQNKRLISGLDDPIEDWHFVQFMFLSTSRIVVTLWLMHGVTLFGRIWWKGDIKSSDLTSINSTVVVIGKKAWTETYSAIPYLLLCLVILIVHPIFRVLEIGFGLSRGFKLRPVMASVGSF